MNMRRCLLLMVALQVGLAAPSAHAQATVKFSARVCDVTSFGASASRITFDTLAFQKAIDSCSSAGGGTVRVPRGEYRLGPIFIPSDIRLQLDQYAELAFATEPSLYKVTDTTKQYVS